MRMSPLGGIAFALFVFVCLGMVVGAVVVPIKAAYEALSPDVRAEKERAAARNKADIELHLQKSPTREEIEEANRKFREMVTPDQLKALSESSKIPMGK